jgi:hypothetical protein
MEQEFRRLAWCCIGVIVALMVVGTVSHGILRHIVQTSPLWVSIVLSIRGSSFAKWTALPCLIFWLFLMSAIWLFLLGWARIVSGTFSMIEIAMTIIVGVASATGTISAVRIRSRAPAWLAVGIFLLVSLFQFAATWISILPSIAHR